MSIIVFFLLFGLGFKRAISRGTMVCDIIREMPSATQIEIDTCFRKRVASSAGLMMKGRKTMPVVMVPAVTAVPTSFTPLIVAGTISPG